MITKTNLVKNRVWLNGYNLNYNDRRKTLITEDDLMGDMYVHNENNINFYVNDGVNTAVVANFPSGIELRRPNYMVITDDFGTIVSRWFVISMTYLTKIQNGDQYTVNLRRDLVVDYRSQVSNNPCKVRRGMVDRTVWSTTLVQPEGLMLNKIKTDQKNIKIWDKDTQWLTIFYDITGDGNRKIEFDYEVDTSTDLTFTSMQTDYNSTGNFDLKTTGSNRNDYWCSWSNHEADVTFRSKAGLNSNASITYKVRILRNGFFSYVINESQSGANGTGLLNNLRYNTKIGLDSLNLGSVRTVCESFNFSYSNAYTTLRNKYQGKFVKIGTPVKRINISTHSQTEYDKVKSQGSAVASALNTAINSVYKSWDKDMDSYSSNNNIFAQYYDYFNTVFTTIENKGQIELPKDTKLDELNIGCVTIPFGDGVRINEGGTYLELDGYSLKSIFTTGWTEAGSAIKDIQILPYCPSSELNTQWSNSEDSNDINITLLPESSKVKMSTTGESAAFYYAIVCKSSSMSYNYKININDWFGVDIKLDDITKSIRFVSNNHKAIFEMSPTKNNGIDNIIIEYTLRPYNTIYKIVPIFKPGYYYGGSYGDSRGLIWEGGFSLSQVTDAWTEYKLSNSTYEAMFNRDVKNIEITNENARMSETLSYQHNYQNHRIQMDAAKQRALLEGVIGVGGMVGGVASGNPMAMMGGVGVGASAVGSMIGMNASNKLANSNMEYAKQSQMINSANRSENLQYKMDVFNLNNTAIQASPGGLSISTDYSIINNSKAYIELYDCTPDEKNRIDDMFTYNGIKIDRIGDIKNYLFGDMCYIEATILRCPGFTPYETNELNSELSSGIYVQEGLFNKAGGDE